MKRNTDLRDCVSRLRWCFANNLRFIRERPEDSKLLVIRY